MTLEITVGPAQIAINEGHSVLVTDRDGQIRFPSNMGLYFFDTRLVSNWMIFANGGRWQLLNSGNLCHYASRVFLTNPAITTEQGTIAPHTLQLCISRSIDGGMHEDIRTLSANHPSYNPFSYQNGSVWPHDMASSRSDFGAMDLLRRPLVLQRGLAKPEAILWSIRCQSCTPGFSENSLGFPVQYLGANVPQAWAAGSAFSFLQALLGLVPDAPNSRLYIDPALPDWLPDVRLTNLRVGAQPLDIQFFRHGSQTLWEVLSGPRDIVSERTFATGPTLNAAFVLRGAEPK